MSVLHKPGWSGGARRAWINFVRSAHEREKVASGSVYEAKDSGRHWSERAVQMELPLDGGIAYVQGTPVGFGPARKVGGTPGDG